MMALTETRAQKAVRVTRAARIFDAMVSALLWRVRKAMSVPDRADEETEASFRALRERLDAHFPEFRDIYGQLLVDQLGEAHADGVLAHLEAPPLQAYFRASAAIEAELSVAGTELMRAMAELACSGEDRKAG